MARLAMLLAAVAVAASLLAGAGAQEVSRDGSDLLLDASGSLGGDVRMVGDGFNTSVSEVLEVVSNLTALVAMLQTLNTRLEARVAALETDAATTATMLAEIKGNASMLSGRVDGVDARVVAIEGANLPSAVSGLATRVSAIDAGSTGTVAQLTTRVAAAESAATALTTRVTAVDAAGQGSVAQLATRVSAAETAAASLAARVSTVDATGTGTVAQLTTRVAAAESAATALTTRMTAVDAAGTGSVATLATQVAALQTSSGVATRVTALEAKTGATDTKVASLTTDVGNLKPFLVFETKAAGRYDLRTIFDTARRNGLDSHIYDCIIKTNNGAHWRGRSFKIIANYYLINTHGGFPHRIYDVLSLDAGAAGGCSAGLTTFSVGPNSVSQVGYFDYSPGNCFQNLRIMCEPHYETFL